MILKINSNMGNALVPPPVVSDQEAKSVLDYDVSLDKIAQQISDGEIQSILVMAGAGISVSAGNLNEVYPAS